MTRSLDLENGPGGSVGNFREALWLPGWSNRSIWGYDAELDTFFAQLWRDGDTRDDPRLWIGGVDAIDSHLALAKLIASFTENDEATVVRAILYSAREA